MDKCISRGGDVQSLGHGPRVPAWAPTQRAPRSARAGPTGGWGRGAPERPPAAFSMQGSGELNGNHMKGSREADQMAPSECI